MPDERGALRRIFRDMDGAPADERAAAGAGAELRQCHSNRHETILFFDAGIAADRSHAAHAKPGGSRKRDAPQMPGIRRFQRLFVPKLHSFPRLVNKGIGGCARDHG